MRDENGRAENLKTETILSEGGELASLRGRHGHTRSLHPGEGRHDIYGESERLTTTGPGRPVELWKDNK